MMAKQRSPDVLTEEQREEIAARREAELWGMAQRIGGPQALRELLPKLDKQAMIVHSVGFDDLAKEIGVVAAVAKLGFETQFIEAAKRNGLLGATARLGYGPGAKAVYRARTNSLALRPTEGAGADSTLLEQAIRAKQTRFAAVVNKAIRTYRTRLAQREISKAGVDSRKAEADKIKERVLALYDEGKRRSVIATRVGVSVRRVGQIINARK